MRAGKPNLMDAGDVDFRLFLANFCCGYAVHFEPIGKQVSKLIQNQIEIFIAMNQRIIQIKNDLLQQGLIH
ncbi:hypothetical protein D3C81_1161220 [compost metagenome]